MGKECARFHKILATKLAAKFGKPYSITMSWLRAKLSFCLLRSSLLCLRGTRVPFYMNNTSLFDTFYYLEPFEMNCFNGFYIFSNVSMLCSICE